MKLPTISIITPSFNQAEFIEETIGSVLSQGYPHLDYWVIDGGSTDGTLNILKKYKGRLNYISERDAGQTHAINKGLERSKGDVLAYLNSDDLYAPGTLGKVGKIFTNKKIHWLTGDYQMIDESGNKIRTFIPTYKSWLLSRFTPGLLRSTNSIIPQPSTFWSREAYERVGKFNHSLHYAMDYDYWLRLSQQYQLTYLPEVLSYFRSHDQSKSNTGYRAQFKEEHQVLLDHGVSLPHSILHLLHTRATLVAYSLLK